MTRKSRRNHGAEFKVKVALAVLAEARQGKRTLRTHAVEFKPAPEVTPRDLVRVGSISRSRGRCLRYTSAPHVRTLENWEQGRAKPNVQAALLIKSGETFSGHRRTAFRHLKRPQQGRLRAIERRQSPYPGTPAAAPERFPPSGRRAERPSTRHAAGILPDTWRQMSRATRPGPE